MEGGGGGRRGAGMLDRPMAGWTTVAQLSLTTGWHEGDLPRHATVPQYGMARSAARNLYLDCGRELVWRGGGIGDEWGD